MASPQPDKYTGIANELMEQIPYFKFNGAQFRIIMVVWRNTYGWKRKDHDLSLTFLHERTGIPERTVKHVVSGLIKANVLIETKAATKTSARRLAFNKNYEEWDVPRGGDSMNDIYDEGQEISPPIEENEVQDSSPHEGQEISPPIEENEVQDSSPHEGQEISPQVITMRGKNPPPKKESSLKKSFKENVEFEDFYSYYPRKISKQAALKAWKKLSKEEDFDHTAIITNTINFAKTCELLNTEARYIPHPSTFLNQKRYEDYPTVDPEGLAKSSGNKFDSNLDFFKNQLGGGGADQGSSFTALGEGIRSLPE
ncbi:replication protein [Paenibacillus sp. MMO-58]|uniref:replication protein n=1 Tax=Paenibacillus sp. MMO-58 TaxID=3081290 RepID=UPI003017C7D9